MVLFDTSKLDYKQGFAYMAMSQFLLSLGLMSNWVGFMEYHLLLNDQYEDFLRMVEEQNNGKHWKDLRQNMMTTMSALKKAMNVIMGEENFLDTRAMVEKRIDSYDADKLKEDLSLYLTKHPQEKIVFFIDEVSESIAQKKINLLDLEGLSESLSALGNRVWTVGIAQQAFNDVLNAAGLNYHCSTRWRLASRRVFLSLPRKLIRSFASACSIRATRASRSWRNITIRTVA